ncbi:FAD binding domain-containing protein [Aminivibrio sp.]|uniref:FAD binding domain-containing protein n=1 Tax=Aminivibrio sp. TaxID=1872489 RepID=UPI001A58A423|nr:FAD binding domain-containing protein [Aminivibrio sp.]MBL3539370.1 FAD binding domain-containing protein [Aminivibrio sp.]
MIARDFDYILPESLEEARDAWREEKQAGKNPAYYGGGTEIVALARSGAFSPDCVIDLKGVPECRALGCFGGRLVFGAACSLTDAVERGGFPLLSAVARTVADKTVRNRLSLGGNVCGALPYREAVLPFLCAAGVALVFGSEGLREEALETAFDRRLKLGEGEFLVALVVDERFASLPFASSRKVRGGRVDYPLCSGAAVRDGETVDIALSGVFDYPVALSAAAVTPPEKVAESLPHRVREDALAGAGYRKALLVQVLEDILLSLEVLPS